ncbi:MAG: hypothetical protein JXB00_15510 [Bacteroidales bacterium]|nr:hypothetical protein [Bacteroidales bacterium]
MQKIMLRQFLLTILLLNIIITSLSAQVNQSTAVSTVKGAWIFLGNEIPKEFEYHIFKKQRDGNFTLIGKTSYLQNVSDMKTKIAEYNLLFNNLDKPDDRDFAKIRNYASKNNTTDSIIISNLPVMHLALGTAFFDSEVSSGNTYQYRVVKMKDRDTKVWERNSNILQYPVKVNILQPVFKDKQESGSQIVLRWYVKEQMSLNSFNLFRRVFGKGEFLKIPAVKGFNTSHDSVYLVAVDTTIQNPAYYEYYIEPVDIYGNPGPKSEAVSAGTIGDAYVPTPEYFRARGSEKGHQVELSWKFKDKKYLRSIEVFRSPRYDNGYIKVAQLTPEDTLFIDVVPVANENFWYYLKISGPMSQSMPSAKVSGMYRGAKEKPLPPDETGAESIKGGVKIYWKYHQPHAKGFYVYRYVYEKAEYMQISGLIPAGADLYSYIDSFKLLPGNDIYRYAIRAVNDVDQLSDYSPSASASPGIKANISAPVNLRINPVEKGFMVIWDDLRNIEPVLLGYKIYRKTNSEKFTLLPNDTLRSDKNYFGDTTLLPGNNYSYAVSAIDFYGNESAKSNPVSYKIENEFIIPPEIYKAVNTTDGIMITWGQITSENVASVKLYRSQPGKNPQVIATIEKETDQYLDKSVAKGQLYIYQISLTSKDKQESEKSRGITIRRN